MHLQTFLALLLASLATALDYSEIVRFNASCTPKDTCSLPRDLDHPDLHNCDCSALCALYDTCCIDSPFLDLSRKYRRRTASCRPAGGATGQHVFMVDTCPKSYGGPADIRRRCEEEPGDWSDPFAHLPVTHSSSQRTYKSLSCCLCNGLDPRTVVMWQLMLDCTRLKGSMQTCAEDKQFVLENMLYVGDKWGLWSHDQEGDWMFRQLDITFKVPDGIKKFVKDCRPNLVSGCLADWKDDRVRKLCRSYTAAVYFSSATYRNIHCAICNREADLGSMSCHETRTSAFKGPSVNFGILLDFDLRHGDRVGHIDGKCQADQVYDPFSKKCRNIECPLPGFTLKEGKCVKN